MTIAHYNTLRENNKAQLDDKEQQSQSLGVELPSLIASNLCIEASRCLQHELAEKIADFAPEQGWVCYRDSIEIGAEIPTRVDIIEGEYCRSNDTLVIKQGYDGFYHLTFLKPSEQAASGTMAYRQQTFLTRTGLLSDGLAIRYRIWFEQTSNGQERGRWQAKVQQFVGFVGD